MSELLADLSLIDFWNLKFTYTRAHARCASRFRAINYYWKMENVGIYKIIYINIGIALGLDIALG